ncbi:MAG: GDYXXLXY domain-containing protein [Chloroflexi bacterium]|nr:GDYXXLXY domain-containing protein [Chloroflexota bacterium]
MKIAFWATVAGQIILLLAFIAVKENTLRSGTSVLLQTVPVDPRSLLQGDYAILGYEIAELPAWATDSKLGDRFFVELIEGEDGVWRAGRYSREKFEEDGVFIKGTVNSRGRLDLGIGTYFIPEGTGRIIEQAVDVKVRVAVSSGGTAVIEELLVDGAPFDPRSVVQPLRPPEGEPLPPGQARPLSGGAVGVADFNINVNGDALEFRNAFMLALPGVEIVVTFNNSSSVNSHNLVIVQPRTKDAVAADGIVAGPANDWVPPGDPRVIASTRLVAPGSTGEVRFMAPKPGLYQFVCTFPGHNLTMFGDFIVLDPARGDEPQRDR